MNKIHRILGSILALALILGAFTSLAEASNRPTRRPAYRRAQHQVHKNINQQRKVVRTHQTNVTRTHRRVTRSNQNTIRRQHTTARNQQKAVHKTQKQVFKRVRRFDAKRKRWIWKWENK